MQPPATSLDCRLLCASACAYDIEPAAPSLHPGSAPIYYQGAGFLQPPATFSAGVQNIDGCLVGTTGDGVVVAFRGTLPIDGPFTLRMLRDWINDLNAAPVAGAALPGAVHRGFLGSLDALWAPVREEVKRQLALPGAAGGLWITGHSKGGGIAPLAAMRLRTQDGINAKVVTFAAPKSGDAAFADTYNGVFDHTRYEYADDVVPHLPPSAPLLTILSTVAFLGLRLADLAQFDYERVGKLIYITRSLQLLPDPDNSLLEARRRSLLGLILRGQLQQIGDDHRIACGYGYMTALCPSGVCPPPAAPSALDAAALARLEPPGLPR